MAWQAALMIASSAMCARLALAMAIHDISAALEGAGLPWARPMAFDVQEKGAEIKAAAILAIPCLSFPSAFLMAGLSVLMSCAIADRACGILPDKGWAVGCPLLLAWQVQAGLPDPWLLPFSAAFAALCLALGLRGWPFGDMKLVAGLSLSCGICMATEALALAALLKLAADRDPSPLGPYLFMGTCLAVPLQTLQGF